MKFPLFGGGSGNYTRKLAEKLTQSGRVEVAIAAPDTRPLADDIKLYTIKPQRRAVFVSHPEYKNSTKYQDLNGKEFTDVYSSYFRQITDIVEDFKPDVIHVNHCHFLTWIANYIKSIYGIAYVVSAHGTDIYQSTIDHRMRILTRQALERSEFILSNSNYTNKWLLKIFGHRLKRKTRILPCGVDLQAYPRDHEIKIINEKYHLDGKKVVIFVGRLTWEKGVIYLLKAASLINAEIFIIGSGAEKLKLQNFAKSKNLKNVHFLGYFGKEYIEELREFYKRADCVVVPSICDEGIGIVVLEAMASETPVVATNKGGIPLAVKDGKTGFLVRAKSSKLLAEGINKVLDNEKLRHTLGQNARKLVEEKFDWVRLSEMVYKYYSQSADVSKKLKQKQLPPGIDEKDLERELEDLEKKVDYNP